MSCGNAIRTTNKLCIYRSHLWRSKHEIGLVPPGITIVDNIKTLFGVYDGRACGLCSSVSQ